VSSRGRELLREWGYENAADRYVRDLEPLGRKIVEICRALNTGARILLLDEPTAGLDGNASRLLFERIAEMRGRGLTVVYVSHYLEEVFEVCDTVTVLRDGKVVLTQTLEGMTVSQLVGAMIGEARATFERIERPASSPGGSPLLSIRNLSIGNRVKDFSLDIFAGETVGLAGLDGSGIVQVAEALFGLVNPDQGKTVVRGKLVPAGKVQVAMNSGIGYLPEDRHHSGFVAGMANEENVTLTVLSRLRNALGLIDTGRRRLTYERLARRWDVKADSPRQNTEELSGGNQQKIALARTVANEPAVLVLVNPTAGVDVAAKAAISESIDNLVRDKQCACLVVSSDESEFIICDRLLVMFRGHIVTELTPPWTKHQLASAVQGDLIAARS
jgi:simple sugar transport system ATP-binding protein